MKRLFTLLLTALLISAMVTPLAAPANATVDTDGLIDMQDPYEEVTFHVPADDLTKVYEWYVPIGGTYIIQSFGALRWDIDKIVLRDANYNVVNSEIWYTGYGEYQNILLSCFLPVGGYYYLEFVFYGEQDARISITYAQEHYSNTYDDEYNPYLADFDHILLEDMNNLTFYFTSDNGQYAQIILTGCYVGDEAPYNVYVEGWDGAVAYVMDPTSTYLYSGTVATSSAPGSLNMSPDQLYYVVVYLGDTYGYGTPVDVAVVTVRFERAG